MQHEYYEASILTTPCPFPSQNIEERSWGAVLVWSSSSFSSSPDGRTLILIWWRVERSRERERESTAHRSHIELGLAGASSDKEARSHTRRSYTAKVISMNAAGG